MAWGGGGKKKPLSRRLLEWPDVITFCKWAPCLLNYTHHLWIAVNSQGRCGKMERWVRHCWRVRRCHGQVLFLGLSFTAGCSWNPTAHSDTRWIPISQLCTIDFVWICKCSDLQANPVMESAGTLYQRARRHRGNGSRFHLTGLSVQLDQIALRAEIWQCTEEGNQEMSDCGAASAFQNLQTAAGNVVSYFSVKIKRRWTFLDETWVNLVSLHISDREVEEWLQSASEMTGIFYLLRANMGNYIVCPVN